MLGSRFARPQGMRVLVTWGSQRGGTEGIARVIADTLEHEGLEVDLLSPKRALHAHGFDAVIVGGALYANRWHEDARHFVAKRERDLRRVPVWFFSSGPLDDSADHANIPPTRQVAILMERVGAQSHVTFGGRLEKNAKGFIASAMAKTKAGDFRNTDRIRAWAREIAHVMPDARPRPAVIQAGHSIATLLAHGAIGWAACAAAMTVLMITLPQGAAIAIHALAAPIVFTLIARHYFAQRGAREPLAVALAFTAITAVLDAVAVAWVVFHSAAMLASIGGFWLPLALIFSVTFLVGEIASMGPLPKHA